MAKPFERIRGKPYATCKRRVDGLERTWRANFAARDTQGGLRGNNNTDLARAMRAWIAFRDEEEREKKEKEDDVKALEVRRRRLHELETERLGLTEVCRYDTRVVTEVEEIGPHGIETNEHQLADGDDSNPITIDDEPIIEPLHQTAVDPLEDLEPPKPKEQLTAADQIAPIVELLRKRQREEREESDIRREEQVLLNKRLAMMEEQVQMLSKLITQNNPPPATSSPQGDADMDNSAEVTAEPDVEVETTATREPIHDTIVIDDAPVEDALEERPDVPLEPRTTTKLTSADTNTHTAGDFSDLAADERSDTSLRPGASTGPENVDVGESLSNEATGMTADVSLVDNAEPPDGPSAELENTISISTNVNRSDGAQVLGDAAAGSPTSSTRGAIDAETRATDEDHAVATPSTTEITES